MPHVLRLLPSVFGTASFSQDQFVDHRNSMPTVDFRGCTLSACLDLFGELRNTRRMANVHMAWDCVRSISSGIGNSCLADPRSNKIDVAVIAWGCSGSTNANMATMIR